MKYILVKYYLQYYFIDLEKALKNNIYMTECIDHLKNLDSIFISSEYLNCLNLNVI